MDLLLQPVSYRVQEKSFVLFEPDKEVVVARYQKGETAFPYWSQVWPAAAGLAQFILQNPQYIVDKKVLELAAGLGLPSLVAATSRAAAVTASDYAPEAIAAMQQTMAYHQLQNTVVRLLDWTALPDDLTADTLLLSDVSYDEKLFVIQEKAIRAFLQKETTVIISTPQRLVAKNAVLPLLSFCISQQEAAVLHQQQMVAISIFVLQQQPSAFPAQT